MPVEVLLKEFSAFVFSGALTVWNGHNQPAPSLSAAVRAFGFGSVSQ
jgi:hypothetical protein